MWLASHLVNSTRVLHQFSQKEAQLWLRLIFELNDTQTSFKRPSR
jgi:hypothetical protein